MIHDFVLCFLNIGAACIFFRCRKLVFAAFNFSFSWRHSFLFVAYAVALCFSFISTASVRELWIVAAFYFSKAMVVSICTTQFCNFVTKLLALDTRLLCFMRSITVWHSLVNVKEYSSNTLLSFWMFSQKSRRTWHHKVYSLFSMCWTCLCTITTIWLSYSALVSPNLYVSMSLLRSRFWIISLIFSIIGYLVVNVWFCENVNKK